MKELKVLRPRRHRGGWVVLPIHYSADPEKDVRWAALEKAKYMEEEGLGEADWAREMDFDFRAQVGTPAYWGFVWETCTEEGLAALYDPVAPLALCVDFNAGIMVWAVGQVFHGSPVVFNEIVEKPATVPGMVRDFLNRWITHRGDLVIYGDATGKGEKAQFGKSDYDILLIELGHFPGRVIMKVPRSNPREKDRVNAVNRMFMPADGRPRLLIDRSCERTILDCQLVESGDSGIVKVRRADDPRSELTHAMDGVGYWIAREWPVRARKKETEKKRRAPLKYGRLPGDLPTRRKR